MIVRTVKTERILHGQKTIEQVLDAYLPKLKDESVIAITSKLVSVCENNIVGFDESDLDSLTKKEADFYLESGESGNMFTIKNNTLLVRAGVDKNTKRKYYILWPKNPQKTTNSIRNYLQAKTGIKNLGIIITDSISTPLRRGVTGIALAYSGFKPLNNYTKTSRANIAGGLAAAAVMIMGEGSENTPIAVIDEIPFVSFSNLDPTVKELDDYFLSVDKDMFAPILKKVNWQKGGKS